MTIQERDQEEARERAAERAAEVAATERRKESRRLVENIVKNDYKDKKAKDSDPSGNYFIDNIQQSLPKSKSIYFHVFLY